MCVCCSQKSDQLAAPLCPTMESSLDSKLSENFPISAGRGGHATFIFHGYILALFFQEGAEPGKYVWVSASQPHPGDWEEDP